MTEKNKFIANRVAIIVPVYNTEKYLNSCISSIIDQTYLNIEILIVDDGSTDSSLDICNEFAKKDRRIRVIEKKNGGVSSARNIGIINSNSEYITFVDSDDIIEKDMVDILVRNIRKADVSIINEKAIRNTDIISQIKTTNKMLFFSGEEATKIMLYGGNINNSIHGLMYRKKIFSGILFNDTVSYGEDLDFKFNILTSAKKITQSSKVGYFYIEREDSAMHKPFTNKRAGSLFISLNKLKDVSVHIPILTRAARHKVFLESLSIIREIDDRITNKVIYNECILQLKRFRVGVILDKSAPIHHRIYAIITLVNLKLLLHILNYKNKLLKR